MPQDGTRKGKASNKWDIYSQVDHKGVFWISMLCLLLAMLIFTRPSFESTTMTQSVSQSDIFPLLYISQDALG